MTSKSPRLAIAVKGWPRLSETFIAQELVALEEAGIDFAIWSLRHPTDKKTHPLHDRLKAEVHYLPEYLGDEPMRVLRGLLFGVTHRAFWPALRQFLRDLARDRTRNRVRRFGQACVMARELPADTTALYAHFLHTPSSVARYAAMLRGVPWSFSAHAKDIWTSIDWELQEKLDSATAGAAFGATCTALGAKYLNGLSKDTPVDLVYHGLDLSRFPPAPERTRRTPTDPFHMLSVGRLVEKKGFDRLLDAMALLPADMDWHWTHIGGGTLADALQQQAKRLGLSDRITWHGACDQPEVIDAMRQSNLFVLPSRVAADGDRDGLPNVLMEAASQKLPILSTPISAIPEFIDDGVHGILSGDDPVTLADAMARVAHDPALGVSMAEAAHARLHADFTMQPGIAHLARRLRAIMGAA
ncbi:colanic acid biosynthesis glycosyltransferase WcaL [Tateyamaria omphalii]|uniref:glycosyltransferase family 4 protein n=1 Tax=Tateyamaria omphalii TaxID=299262 RepID=UPI001671ED47|nr:glycosyltransferase family 4 protein [Tateyamaria omphalii]GGX58815.1 colanic acid biosynthesis glycosyltransferase WcaL [Tateyamaria omphalii]